MKYKGVRKHSSLSCFASLNTVCMMKANLLLNTNADQTIFECTPRDGFETLTYYVVVQPFIDYSRGIKTV